MAETKTLVVDNFTGYLNWNRNGDINSGYANIVESFGYAYPGNPKQLVWAENPVLIDPSSSVITDLIVAGKTRVESGINYVYCIGHTGRLYKIQVNDPTTYNPDYDNPVLLATLTAQSPTFKRGGFIDFFGATERIYIGHDKGVTRINFDGTSETFVGVLGSWTQNVPRPLRQFTGKLYIGNGSNLAEIDSTATVTTYTKLSPSFPTNTQVRDLDVSPDGTYLQSVVSELALTDITLTTPDTNLLASSNSFIFKWNGTDIGYTSFTTYTGTVLTAGIMFSDKTYYAGYDIRAGGLFDANNKIITCSPATLFSSKVLPNAMTAISGMVAWIDVLPFQGNTLPLLMFYGSVAERELPVNYWNPVAPSATSPETDVLICPFLLPVSNFAQGPSSNGYTSGIIGNSKVYYSTLETSSSPTTKYRLYKWNPFPSGGEPHVAAVYQTQTQLFSKKVIPQEVRVYGEPWVTGNAYIVDLIGSDGNPITGGSKTFTAGSTLTVGNDYASYTPSTAPTYAIGLRITNDGTTNMVINKVEIDFTSGGK